MPIFIAHYIYNDGSFAGLLGIYDSELKAQTAVDTFHKHYPNNSALVVIINGTVE